MQTVQSTMPPPGRLVNLPPNTPEAVRKPVILCVDDEPNILSSLRRLFRGYQVLIAESGQAGLEILATQPVDLVISDMRMPEMNGVQFLEAVRSHWPETVRLLLTGYADVQSIMDAINRGEIYRYIAKPWDDNDMLLIVRHALERQFLAQEKQRLEALTLAQNDALKALNLELEERVRQRTDELKRAHDGLLKFNSKLKANFLESIKVFSNLIEMRGGNLAGHSLRVADLARKLAERMALEPAEAHDIFVAGLLHNIGKIGLSDELLALPLTLMSGEQLGMYRKHPVRGEQLLMPLADLRGAAALVRSYQERFDGGGYPDGLAGLAIPLGSRILALASDYDNLQIGIFMQRKLRPDEACAAILHGRGSRYDPALVDAFMHLTGAAASTAANSATPTHAVRPVLAISAAQLLPGMTLARDLVTADGALLLSAEHAIDARLIRQIVDFEKTLATPLAAHVYQE